MKADYEKLFAAFMHETADAAGKVTLKYFRKVIPVDDKDDQSPVTEADRAIEQVVRDRIAKEFPSHGIIGEEFPSENTNAEFVWCIDPIDGTKSFVTGRPLFGTIIGLLHNGRPVAGIIDQAYTRERWFGVANKFATHNGKPVHVAPPRGLAAARLYTGSINMFEGANFEGYLRLCRAAKLTHYACDAYAYGLLAMGWADVVVEQCLKIYDVAGAAPIINGAGGFIGDWQGKPIDINFKGEAVAASTKELAMKAVGNFSLCDL
jgi:inositol-phosphate phosphatase / L-galactose 1-phosphate phosphatase / histidinol-phosphatase